LTASVLEAVFHRHVFTTEVTFCQPDDVKAMLRDEGP
jgi:hypothetical protein